MVLPSRRCTSFLVSTTTALTTWPCARAGGGGGVQQGVLVGELVGLVEVARGSGGKGSRWRTWYAASLLRGRAGPRPASAHPPRPPPAHLCDLALAGLLDGAGDDVADGGEAAARLDALNLRRPGAPSARRAVATCGPGTCAHPPRWCHGSLLCARCQVPPSAPQSQHPVAPHRAHLLGAAVVGDHKARAVNNHLAGCCCWASVARLLGGPET